MSRAVYKKVQRFFFVLILKYLPPCKELIDIASASLDRKLTWRESIVLKLHLIPCKPCVRFIEQSKFMREMMKEFDSELADELQSRTLSDDARSRLKAVIKTAVSL
ncbi:MAG: hypothetical protein IT173_08230 [Acidobacteria bacterium]|nr:hypothetical protein [Acidobacteriota bacterium]